jgi:glycosyltransferase involved in cell wall biosynthesis
MKKIKSKICWITPDYFLCVDPFIVPHLINEFEIEWILINARNTKRKADGLVSDTIKPKEYNLKFRQKDPRIIWQYIKFLRQIRKSNFDLIYISYHGFPFFFPVFLKFINPNKVIWGIHNVNTPKGASNERWMDKYQNYVCKRIKHFHVFSKYQLGIIKEMLPGKNHYYAPLTLEDYGPSKVIPPDNVIRFLFFGYIKEYKRLDLLIKSFQELRNSGCRNIELFIAGNCENWEYYQSIITEESGIKTRIEVIPNKDIPDLVSSCHYMVLPYKDGAQSAVLTLAYQYNKPVIVSDIEAFKQFVINGSTGFTFKNESQESLTETMHAVVQKHKENYETLKENIHVFIEKEFAIDKIVNKYRYFLHKSIES